MPAAAPLAIDGRLNAAPGGFSDELSEIDGSTLMPATAPLWSFCWYRRRFNPNFSTCAPRVHERLSMSCGVLSVRWECGEKM